MTVCQGFIDTESLTSEYELSPVHGHRNSDKWWCLPGVHGHKIHEKWLFCQGFMDNESLTWKPWQVRMKLTKKLHILSNIINLYTDLTSKETNIINSIHD